MALKKNGSGSSLLLLLVLLAFPLCAQQDSASAQIQAIMQRTLNGEVSRWQLHHLGDWKEHSIQVSLPTGVTSLAPCQGPLSIEGGNGRFPTGRQHRRISCQQPAWSVTIRAKVTLSARIPVTRSKIMAGTVLNRSMIQWQERQLSPSDADLLLTLDPILGLRARRGIRAGSPLKAHQLLPPLMVERGQQVVIVAQTSDFIATTAGIALQAGAKDEVIKVKNSRSGKTISARVIDRGKVQTFF